MWTDTLHVFGRFALQAGSIFILWAAGSAVIFIATKGLFCAIQGIDPDYEEHQEENRQ